MANAIALVDLPGQVRYATLRSDLGLVWNGSGFEAENLAHWPQYAIPLAEVSPGSYYAAAPPGVPPGNYWPIAYAQTGASPTAPPVDIQVSDPGPITVDREPVLRTMRITADWTTGATLYASLYNGLGMLWGGAVFGYQDDTSYPATAIPLAESPAGTYTGSVPSGVPFGTYGVVVRLQRGDTPASTDAILTRMGVVTTAPAGRRRRIDPRGLIHTVAILRDARADGRGDSWGDASPNPTAVPGLGNVPCRVVQLSAREVEAAGKARDVAQFTVLYGAPIVLDGTNYLQWQEPGGGLLWLIKVEGQSRNEGGMGHHWSVDGAAFKQEG